MIPHDDNARFFSAEFSRIHLSAVVSVPTTMTTGHAKIRAVMVMIVIMVVTAALALLKVGGFPSASQPPR